MFDLPTAMIAGPLTEAERAVVAGALAGQTNASIAQSRGTSSRTIANQLKSACTKLGVSGRAELAAFAAIALAEER